MGYFEQMAAQERVKEAATRQADIARLRQEEGDAKDEDARNELKARRESLEAEAAEAPVKGPELGGRQFQDPRYLGFFLADLASGLLLNLLMLIAGIGLVFLKGWGRAMAVFVAWSKIVRLLLLALLMTAVVAPYVTTAFAAMTAEARANNPQAAAGAPGPEAATSIGIAMTAGFWVLFALGVIYPGLEIWFLTRPPVRAACGGRDEGTPKPSW